MRELGLIVKWQLKNDDLTQKENTKLKQNSRILQVNKLSKGLD